MSRKSLKEAKKSGLSVELKTLHAPLLVRIKEYFPKENRATVQIVSSKGSPSGGFSIPNIKFPIKGPCHENMSRAIQAGETHALLYYAGRQISNGYLELSHDAGVENTVTYAPIRHSWSV